MMKRNVVLGWFLLFLMMSSERASAFYVGARDSLLSLHRALFGDIPHDDGSFIDINADYLDLDEFGFGGTIQTEIGLMSNLEEIYGRKSDTLGSLPSQIGHCAALECIEITKTNVFSLEGQIPSELGRLTALTTLRLVDQKLGGSLYLSESKFDANIPSELGCLTKLNELSLFGNELQGTIPTELGLLTNLLSLDLGWNKLDGIVPSELGLLTCLTHLGLRNNLLQVTNGAVPSELHRLTNLRNSFMCGLGNQQQQ